MTQQYEKKTVEAGAGGSIPEKLDRINRNLETLMVNQGRMQTQLTSLVEQANQSMRSHHQELSQEMDRIGKVVQVLQTG